MSFKKTQKISFFVSVLLFGIFSLCNITLADSHAYDTYCINKGWRKCDAWCTEAGAWCNARIWSASCTGTWYNIKSNSSYTSVECCSTADCASGELCNSSHNCVDDPSDNSHAVNGPVCVSKTYRKCDSWCTKPGAWCNATTWTSHCDGSWYNTNDFQNAVECCASADCPPDGNECTVASCDTLFHDCGQTFLTGNSCNSGSGVCYGPACISLVGYGKACVPAADNCYDTNVYCASDSVCRCTAGWSNCASCGGICGENCTCYTGGGSFYCSSVSGECEPTVPPTTCTPTNCAVNTCIGTPCWNGCAFMAGTKNCDGSELGVTLSAPFVVLVGEDFELTWTTTNSPDLCMASGDWSGSKGTAASNSETITAPSSEDVMDFTITCSKPGYDSVTASAPVNVTTSVPPPPPATPPTTPSQGGGWQEVSPSN